VAASLSTQTATQSTMSTGNSTPTLTPTAMATNAYAIELLLLKNEIAQLKTTLAMATENIC